MTIRFNDEQFQVLEGIMDRALTAAEYEGFLIVGGRFVDRFGGTRIANWAGSSVPNR